MSCQKVRLGVLFFRKPSGPFERSLPLRRFPERPFEAAWRRLRAPRAAHRRRPDRRSLATEKKLQKSALKALKSLSRVTLCAGAVDTLEREWAPARFGGTGPCFAARRNVWEKQMLTGRDAWPSVSRDGRQRCAERLSALACRAVSGALALVTPGSFLLVRRSHGYPDFLPPLEGIGRRSRRLLSPVRGGA